MKLFLILSKAYWQGLFEYRGNIVIWTITYAAIPLVSMAMWLAISATNIKLSFSKEELIIYFLLVIWVEVICSAWAASFLSKEIYDGTFSKYLVKPFNLILDYSSQNISEKFYKLVVISLFTTIFMFFVMKNLSIVSPFTIVSILMFIPSLIMAATISFLMNICIGLAAFWFHNIEFLRIYFGMAKQLLSGVIIPIAFLPESILSIAIVLPFRYELSFPIEVLLNKLNSEQLLIGFIVQIFWLIIVISAYKLILRKGIKSYQGYGG